MALSLKQPWAALVVAGLKTVEVRGWATNRIGRIYVHASKLPDTRLEAWAWVPPELKAATDLRGGIIGSAVLTGCLTYDSPEAFVADQWLHLNHPSWFKPPYLYGFTLTGPRWTRFRPVVGNIKFFPVPETSS